MPARPLIQCRIDQEKLDAILKANPSKSVWLVEAINEKIERDKLRVKGGRKPATPVTTSRIVVPMFKEEKKARSKR